jgi:DNA-binding CsgD family transcriptional regulator
MHLSPRETEIMRYVAAGHTTKEAAAELGIAERTAEWHVSNILAKLAASSRAEAVAISLREGLLKSDGGPATSGAGRPGLRAEQVRPPRRPKSEREFVLQLLGIRLGEFNVRTFDPQTRKDARKRREPRAPKSSKG